MNRTTIAQDNSTRHTNLPDNVDKAFEYLRSKGVTRQHKWLRPLPVLFQNVVMWKPNR